MAKFKIGDRVELIVEFDDDNKIPKGSIGTVKEDDSDYPYVLWDYVDNNDINVEERENYEWAVYDYEMELLEENQDINYEIY